MQNTLQATTTPKTVIDKLFELFSTDTIISELLECYFLYADQFDSSDPGTMEIFKEKLMVLNNALNFIKELEKYSRFSDVIGSGYPSGSTPNDFLIFPRQGDPALQDLIESFYSNNDARAITFEIWDTYVSAIGNDSTKAWPGDKHSNIAFTTLHVNTCLINLEFFKTGAIILS